MNGNYSSDSLPENEPQLESAVWAVVSEPIDRTAIERVKEKAKQLAPPMVATQSEEPSRNKTFEDAANPARQRKFRSLIRGALAAIVVLAIGTIFFFPSSSESALTAAIEKLRTVDAFSFDRLTYFGDDSPPAKERVLVSNDGRSRSETSFTVTVFDKSGMPRLTLMEDQKIAIAFSSDDNEMLGFGHLEWLMWLKSHGDGSAKQFGEKKIDGEKAAGFKAEMVEGHELIVWVNTKTRELCQLEHTMDLEGEKYKVITTNFNFAETVDESLFSIEVPPGYDTELSKAINASQENPEKNFIEVLQEIAEFSAGKFPANLTSAHLKEVVKGEVTKIAIAGGELDASRLVKVDMMSRFLGGLKRDSYGYLGDGMTANQDEKKIVFWYHNENGQTRAIFSDLTVGDIDAKDIPQGEQAE